MIARLAQDALADMSTPDMLAVLKERSSCRRAALEAGTP